MAIKAAFIFVAPGADPQTHRQTVSTAEVEVTTLAVADYKAAAQVAASLLQEGCTAIELCGGFGSEGVSLVKQAVAGRIPVGVVRFDYHPGLGFKSGDEVFGSAAQH